MNFADLVRDYEDEALNARITAITSAAKELRIAFECDDWRDPVSRLSLTICCLDTVETAIAPADIGLITYTSDHPLLWQHTEPHAQLYFSSRPANAYELLGRLYTLHTRLFGRWRSVSDYVLASHSDLEAGYGLLASGPLRALTAYHETAASFLRLSLLPNPVSKSLSSKVLLGFGSGYVICREPSVLQFTGST